MAILCIGACGVPTAENAARRAPEGGATEYFRRPPAAVYAAAQRVVADARRTPEWKELQVVHDDSTAGVLIAERRLEGVVPGLRVRDLWSFYVRPRGELTAVTFVFESSDAPTATVGARSWAKARSDIFPAMRDTLGSSPIATRGEEHATMPPADAASPPPSDVAGARPSDAAGARPLDTAGSPQVAPVSDRGIREAAPAAHDPAAARSAMAPVDGHRTQPPASLARVYALLSSSDEWRRATQKRRLGGQEIVAVGSWAQLEARDGRVAVAFPSYPAPPAYDVARLMRFLADEGIEVDVLPGTAFRVE
jgi:hypothetical protein